MASIAPGAVEFQIHQVVPAFQIVVVKSVNRKKRILFVSWSSIYKTGTRAIKIRAVREETGHAKTSNKPETILKKTGGIFFKKLGDL